MGNGVKIEWEGGRWGKGSREMEGGEFEYNRRVRGRGMRRREGMKAGKGRLGLEEGGEWGGRRGLEGKEKRRG